MGIIEKLLDKYYAKKLEEISRDYLKRYYIDKKVVYTKRLMKIYIKDTKWKDKEYILISAVPFSRCFFIMANKDELDFYMNCLNDACEKLGEEK